LPQHVVFITSPLEPEHVERIRAVVPDRVEVLYDSALLPPVRYTADHKGAPFVRGEAEKRRWRENLARADILWDFPPVTPEDRSPMADAPRVRWVQTTSTGVGQLVKLHGLQDSDLTVTTARGIHAGPLAEFVMLGLLAHFRGLRHLEAEQRAHRWVRYCADEMAGKRLLVIGAGDLARGTARLARAFGMEVEAVARDPGKVRANADLFSAVFSAAQLRERMSGADAVVVTVPHTPETEHLIDAAALAAIKPGAAFVNIARGQVVDEAALIEGLREGRIGFAALDVAAQEPLPENSPLWDMPNVLISPHSASTVPAENARIVEIFCHNLRCYVDGRLDAMRNVLDKKLMY
jgi:phosphoglycerate dehydrogenase-like enzyme